MPPRVTINSNYFKSRVIVDDCTGCWNWQLHCLPNGYGTMGVYGKEKQYAHRVAYEYFVGPVLPELELDHLCRNRSCCNPAHLEPVSHKENCKRGEVGQYLKERTHCPQGHIYKDDNLYTYPDGRRACKICVREAGRRYREKKRA
jgi:hypothetical protein